MHFRSASITLPMIQKCLYNINVAICICHNPHWLMPLSRGAKDYGQYCPAKSAAPIPCPAGERSTSFRRRILPLLHFCWFYAFEPSLPHLPCRSSGPCPLLVSIFPLTALILSLESGIGIQKFLSTLQSFQAHTARRALQLQYPALQVSGPSLFLICRVSLPLFYSYPGSLVYISFTYQA